ncbi:MAG: hypothetical protein QM496_01980 [Verrucomicrobiota bacterium]
MKLSAEQRARLITLLGTAEGDHTEVTTAELQYLTSLASAAGEMEAVQAEAEAAKEAAAKNKSGEQVAKPGILDNAKAMVSSNAQLVASNRQLTASAGQARAEVARLTNELATATTDLDAQRTANTELQAALDEAVKSKTTVQQATTDALASAGVPETGLPGKDETQGGTNAKAKTRAELEENLKACETQEERSALLREFKSRSK